MNKTIAFTLVRH